MTGDRRVVFDVNVFLQAMAVPNGPAGRCIQLAVEGQLDMVVSPIVMQELRAVASRPTVIAKLHLLATRTEEFIDTMEAAATILGGFPEGFSYQRDPDDAHYVNLALAAGAGFIVTRDKDLLDLMDSSKPEAADFQKRFQTLQILDPVEFLRRVVPRKQP